MGQVRSATRLCRINGNRGLGETGANKKFKSAMRSIRKQVRKTKSDCADARKEATDESSANHAG